MNPIHSYPNMQAAVRELGPEGFVSAVLDSQRRSDSRGPRPPRKDAASPSAVEPRAAASPPACARERSALGV